MQSISSRNKRICVVLGILSLICYISAIFFAWNSPATGYEASIYTATPIIFWILIIGVYSIGIFLLLLRYTEKLSSRISEHLGYMALIFGSVAILTLSIIRGYVAINITGDTGTHVAFINDIIQNMHIISSNPYPISHIEIASLNLTTGINILLLLRLIPILGIYLYLLGTYLLAKEILPNKRGRYLIGIIGLSLPFGSALLVSYSVFNFVPMLNGFFLIPLLLFLIVKGCKSDKKIYLIATAIFALLAVLFHPLISIVLIAFLIAILVAQIIGVKMNTHQISYINSAKFILNIIIVISLTFVIWYLGFYQSTINSIFESLIGNTGLENDITLSYINTISSSLTAGYSINTYIRIAAINIIIYLSIPIVGIFYLINKNIKEEKYNYLLGLFIFLIIIAGLTIVIAITASGFNFNRFIHFAVMSGIICTGFLIDLIFCKKDKGYISTGKIVSIFLIIAIMLLSIISIYPSPFTLHQTPQNTNQEITAMETLMPVMNSVQNKTAIGFDSYYRFAQYLYGFGGVITNQFNTKTMLSLSEYDYEYDSVPYHFGYDIHDSLGEQMTKKTYVFITKKDAEIYDYYFPEIKAMRWIETDYKHLASDKSVNRLYANGEFSLYSITPL